MNQPQTKNQLRSHPAAETIREMNDGEYAALKSDIADNGQRETIKLLDGEVLDGRNRLKACIELCVDPKFEDVETDDPVAYVHSLNVARRHLGTFERGELFVEKATRGKGESNQIGINADLPPTQEEVAAECNISVRTGRQVKNVLQFGHAALVEEARKGEISVNEAEFQAMRYKALRNKFAGPGSISTGFADWHTPREYIERARTLMGGIDFDPASSEKANETVKADTFYSTALVTPAKLDPHHKEVRERNLRATLDKPWRGKTWLNPPYNSLECEALTKRLVDACGKGDITDAVVLVSDSTDTGWWQCMAAHCSCFGFAKSRISFVNGDTGMENSAAPRGSTLFFFGKGVEQVREVYGDLLHTVRAGTDA